VQAAYNAFDIATLTSAFGEGFPNVIGESMACGIPAVATDVGDVRRIVGALGEVVPPHDPGALAAGWARLRRRLAEEPDLRAAARDAIATRYQVEAMIGRTETILTRLCAGRRAQDIVRDLA
jgi:glycosyltransferase involved in cell wall biosynthesis